MALITSTLSLGRGSTRTPSGWAPEPSPQMLLNLSPSAFSRDKGPLTTHPEAESVKDGAQGSGSLIH